MTLPSCPNSLPLLPTAGAYCGSSRCSPLCSAGFPISVSAPNPLLISEAAIHVGYSVLKTLTAVYPDWVRSQTSPFSFPFKLPCRSVSGDRESPRTCLRQAGGSLTLVRELDERLGFSQLIAPHSSDPWRGRLGAGNKPQESSEGTKRGAMATPKGPCGLELASTGPLA